MRRQASGYYTQTQGDGGHIPSHLADGDSYVNGGLQRSSYDWWARYQRAVDQIVFDYQDEGRNAG